MIQLRTLTLLLAAGFAGSAWAEAPTAEPGPPAVETAINTTQDKTAGPEQQAAEQDKTLYAWDRVGKPLGKEYFFI